MMSGGASGEAKGGVYSSPEAVSVSPIGAASFSYPIAVPPGRNGLQPNLALKYNSYNGNGWIGVGWDLDLGSIKRSTKKGLHYNNNEYTANGSDLVSRVDDWGADYYGAKIEGSFTKYYFNTGDNNWVATATNGTKYYYGSEPASRMGASLTHIYSWHLDRVEDTNGNYMEITYQAYDGQLYPYQILYTGNIYGLDTTKSVEFGLEDRDDIIVSAKTGVIKKTAKRLKTITVKTDGDTVYKYIMDYDIDTTAPNGRSRLDQIRRVDPDDETKNLLPTDLIWINGGDGTFGTADSQDINDESGGGLLFGDINGDGITDLIKYYCQFQSGDSYPTVFVYPYLSDENGDFSEQNLVELEQCYSSSISVAMADITGDGNADIVSNGLSGKVHAYLSNGDGTFSGKYTTTDASAYSIQLSDLNGDGKADLVKKTGNDEIYTYISQGNGFFGTGKLFDIVGQINGFYLGDISGNGMSDILVDVTRSFFIPGLGVISMHKAQVYLAVGNGEFSSSPYAIFPVNTGDYKLSDINGDGLADIVEIGPGVDIKAYLSLGDGEFDTSVPDSCGVYNGTSYMADINDDGMSDLIQVNSSGDNYFLKSNGDGTFGAPMAADGPAGTDPLYLADVTGNGRPEMIKFTGDSVEVAAAVGDNAADSIEEILNPMGGRTFISYGVSSSFQANNIPYIVHPVIFVRQYDYDDTFLSETGFTYSNGYYDYDERDFRGFGYVKQINPDGTTVETTYEQDDDYKKGRPLVVEMRNPGGTLLSKRTFTWESELIGITASKFVKLTNKREDIYGTTNVYTNEAYTSYSSIHGGLETTVKSGSVANPWTVIVMNFTYVNANPSGWVWRKASETTQNLIGLARETTYDYYDNGNLFKKTYVCNDCVADPEEEYHYDSYGNVDYYYDPENNITEYDYDSSTYTYVTDITYPQTGSVTHEVSMSYHPLFGKISQKIDENQHGTNYLYDAYGRIKEINYPEGGQVIYEYSDIFNPSDPAYPLYVKTSVLEDTGVYIDSYEYVDGFGRGIQMITPSANNKKTVINKVYDSMGRNYLTEGPHFHPYNSFQYTDVLPPSGTYPYVQTSYDYHSRPVTVTTPAGSTYYSYNGFTTTITDPDGRVRTVTTDYLGRTIQVTDGSGGSPTLYTYNAAGDLTSVTDANGQVTSINYYMTGLKKNMTDPVMGFWEYEYDLNGNLTKQTDAKHDITEFEYDALNRVKLKTYTIYDDEETQYTHDVFYAYDMGTNGKGLLSSVDNIDVHTSYDIYDGMGRVVKVIKNIAGSGSRETLYEYDKSGKTKKITYPGGYIVTNSYYPGTDLLYTVAGDSVVYATLSNYDPSGKIGKIEYGNGVVTDYIYNAATTRLGSIQTKRGSTYYQNRTYGYTNAGNISSIYDGVNYKTYTYGYDGAGRLDWEESGGNYVDLVYDEAGNITSHTIDMYNDIDISYDTNRKNVIHYATVNSQNYYFSHDPNGNMTLGYDFTIPSQVGQRNISYNANNMPTKIIYSKSGTPDVTTYFMYDGNGARVKKTVGTDTTYYFGDHFEIKNSTPMIYIFAGNMRVAQRENGTVKYFHKDHLGSSTVMTDAYGFKTGYNIEYYPFGGQRDLGDTIPTHYRFTDQELDNENGLYNYDARLYDPIIGRFISPDTIVPDPYNPQSLNRYSYCLNNPLIYVDPSGHEQMTDEQKQAAYDYFVWQFEQSQQQMIAMYPSSAGAFMGPVPILVDFWNVGFEQYNAMQPWMLADSAAGGSGGTGGGGVGGAAQNEVSIATPPHPGGLASQNYYENMINKAIKDFGIDISDVKGKKVIFDPSISSAAITTPDATVRIGLNAFQFGFGWLGSVISHEVEGHIGLQLKKGIPFGVQGSQRYIMNEVQAWSYKLSQAKRFGLSSSDITYTENTRNDYFNKLKPNNKLAVAYGQWSFCVP